MNWTEEQDNQLRAMWASGKTGAEIARTIGRDATRNAVIGRIHRLKLAKRPSPIIRRENPIEVSQPVQPRNFLPERLDSCRWIDGMDAQRVFCGEPAAIGKPYCEAHCARAYVKPEKKK